MTKGRPGTLTVTYGDLTVTLDPLASQEQFDDNMIAIERMLFKVEQHAVKAENARACGEKETT